MRVVVVGGTGLVGTRLCRILSDAGHDVLAAAPSTGIDAVTGDGLERALRGAEVVVDVSNPPSFAEGASLEFFERAGRNLMAAERAAGVKHHVALSVVGTERMLAMAYFRAKSAQEALVKASGIPYTIVRATQFFEFIGTIAQSGRDGNVLRLSSAALQPVAAQDVAAAIAKIAVEPATMRTVEVAGPERRPLVSFAQILLRHSHDVTEVVADVAAPYFGVPIDDQSLVPGDDAVLGATHFESWLAAVANKA